MRLEQTCGDVTLVGDCEVCERNRKAAEDDGTPLALIWLAVMENDRGGDQLAMIYQILGENDLIIP